MRKEMSEEKKTASEPKIEAATPSVLNEQDLEQVTGGGVAVESLTIQHVGLKKLSSQNVPAMDASNKEPAY